MTTRKTVGVVLRQSRVSCNGASPGLRENEPILQTCSWTSRSMYPVLTDRAKGLKVSQERLSPLVMIEFRAHLDLDREEIAEELGVSVDEYSDIECGAQEATPAQLSHIAKLFKCDAQELLMQE